MSRVIAIQLNIPFDRDIAGHRETSRSSRVSIPRIILALRKEEAPAGLTTRHGEAGIMCYPLLAQADLS